MRLPTENDIERTIKESPKDLDDLYAFLIASLVQNNRKNAHLLAWIVFAREPLEFRSLQDAVSIGPETTYTTYEECARNRPRIDFDVIHDNFGTLLDAIDGKVYLIHQSLKDYVERQDPLKTYTKIPSRLIPAHGCMTYLNLEDFGMSDDDKRRIKPDFPLLYYASRFWFFHIETASDIRETLQLEYLLKQIVTPYGYKTRNWIANRSYGSLYQSTSRVSEVAVMFSIVWLAELLLDNMTSGLKNDFCEDDFVRAAVFRYETFLKALLNHEMGMKLVTPKVVQEIAGQADRNIFALLLEKRGADILSTEEVVKAVAGNFLYGGSDILSLLLQQQGVNVPVTEEIVKTAASNPRSGKEILAFLLKQQGVNVPITEEVLKTAASNLGSGKEILEFLLKQQGVNIPITEEVLKTAASNPRSGKEILAFLLE